MGCRIRRSAFRFRGVSQDKVRQGKDREDREDRADQADQVGQDRGRGCFMVERHIRLRKVSIYVQSLGGGAWRRGGGMDMADN